MTEEEIQRLMDALTEFSVADVIAVMVHEAGLTEKDFADLAQRLRTTKTPLAFWHSNVQNSLRDIRTGYLIPEKVPVRFHLTKKESHGK